jgi:hypothetical protein
MIHKEISDSIGSPLTAPVVKSEQERVKGFLSFLESTMVKNIVCMCYSHEACNVLLKK